MVLCEGIWTDQATGKKFLLGCFASISARDFPATQPIFAIYILLTNGRGRVPFRIAVVDVDEQRDPVAELNGELEFPDIRAVIGLDAILMGVSFPMPGEYRVQLFVNNEFVIERSLLIVQVQ
jgi:hypothetical protein